MARGSRRFLLVGLVVALIAGMTATAFVLDQPEVVAGEAELSPKSIDVSGVSETKVVTGTNGLTQVTVPVSWEQPDESWRRSGTVIHVVIKSARGFFAVYDYDKTDFDGFRAFQHARREHVLSENQTRVVEPVRRRTINGMPAVQYRLGTSRDSVRKDWLVLVRGDHAYYMLLGNDVSAKNQNTLAIINSFREITTGT